MSKDGEEVPLQEATHEQVLSDVSESTQCAITRRVRRQFCFGAIVACVILACAGAFIWTGGMLMDISTSSSTMQVGRPFRCCARGVEGKPGICLLGDSNGICCGSEVALLCGKDSTCYLNDWGHPYCCAPHTSGCANVCLDNFTSGKIVSNGGFCNPVSPQGFFADGTVLYVNANWDANTRSYQLNGTENITFVDPPIQLGRSNFTMKLTIIPRNEFGVLYQNDANCGREKLATLFRRLEASSDNGNLDNFTGYFVQILQMRPDDLPSLSVFLVRNSPTMDSRRRLEQTPRYFFTLAGSFRLNVTYQAGVPMSFRIVRYGGNLAVFVNNMPVSGRTFQLGDLNVDVDTGVNAPLEIRPRRADPGQLGEERPANCRFDLNASIRDISMTTTADFP